MNSHFNAVPSGKEEKSDAYHADRTNHATGDAVSHWLDSYYALEKLPDDLLYVIFPYLDCYNILQTFAVSNYFYNRKTKTKILEHSANQILSVGNSVATTAAISATNKDTPPTITSANQTMATKTAFMRLQEFAPSLRYPLLRAQLTYLIAKRIADDFKLNTFEKNSKYFPDVSNPDFTLTTNNAIQALGEGLVQTTDLLNPPEPIILLYRKSALQSRNLLTMPQKKRPISITSQSSLRKS